MRSNEEDGLHFAVAQYLKLCLKRGVVWCHVPNGEKRDIRFAAKLKKMGTKAGWPDLQLFYEGKAYFIELKAQKGQLSQSQKQVIGSLRDQGFEVKICRSLDEVKAACQEWGMAYNGVTHGLSI